MSIIVTLRDDASGELARIHGQLAEPAQKRALMSVIGVRAEQELRNWFFKRDADSPNKHGWPRQHFWARLGKRTAFDPSKTSEDTATVVVADPALAAKINGATIHATGAISPATGKPTKNIAIPLQAAAYGNWPRSGIIPNLFFIRKSDGNGGFLVSREGKDGPLTFWYRLVPEVVVPKDPRALPPTGELGNALAETAQSFFRRNAGGTN